MAFGLKQDDLIKYGIGGAAAIGLVALLIGVNNPELSNPGPVATKRASVKPYASTAGAGGFDVSQAYYGEDEDDDYYDSYEADMEDGDDDYYDSYPADIVVGDHTGHPGPGMPPGGHPGGPPPVGGHPGPIHPDTDGHPGGPLGFRWGGRPYPLQRYHVTNNLWNIFGRRFPYGIFPGTPQLGYPYHPQQYPFFTSPFQCQRWPFSMMPQCRRFRRQPFHFNFPWQNRRPSFNWNRRPGFPGGHPGPFPHPGPVGGGGHPGMPGPH